MYYRSHALREFRLDEQIIEIISQWSVVRISDTPVYIYMHPVSLLAILHIEPATLHQMIVICAVILLAYIILRDGVIPLDKGRGPGTSTGYRFNKELVGTKSSPLYLSPSLRWSLNCSLKTQWITPKFYIDNFVNNNLCIYKTTQYVEILVITNLTFQDNPWPW